MVKNLSANAGDAGDADSVPGLGRSSGGRNGNPFQYSCLRNPLNRGRFQAVLSGWERVGHDILAETPLTITCLFCCLVYSSKKPWKPHSGLKLLPWVFGSMSPAILLPGENHTRVGALTKPWCPVPSESSGKPSKFHYALTSVLSLQL